MAIIHLPTGCPNGIHFFHNNFHSLLNQLCPIIIVKYKKKCDCVYENNHADAESCWLINQFNIVNIVNCIISNII